VRLHSRNHRFLFDEKIGVVGVPFVVRVWLLMIKRESICFTDTFPKRGT